MTDSKDHRLVEVESIVMHMQNDLEQLNQVVLDQNKEIESLRLEIRRLEGKIQTAEEGPETRNPEEERPPHY